MYLSRHAEERVSERTKLTPGLVEDMLKNGVCQKVGQMIDKEGREIRYEVFYSHVKNAFFVAVIDCALDAVLTVLCGRHHLENVRIKKQHLRRAREKWRNYVFGKSVIAPEPKKVKAVLEVWHLNKRQLSYSLGEINPESFHFEVFLVEFVELLRLLIATIEAVKDSPWSLKSIKVHLWECPGERSRSGKVRWKVSLSTIKKRLAVASV